GDEIASTTLPASVRAAADLASLALAQNWMYRLGTRLLPAVMSIFRRGDWISNAPYPLSRWTKGRPLPPFTAGFRSWWRKARAGKEMDASP
ncbi:MAG TPA: hypothetical protein VFS61_09220, partial [Anaerolineales bacterium]|nr:hypothetical protein [Anaerolineales bacterium]